MAVVVPSSVVKTVLLRISIPQPILPMEHLKQQIYTSRLQPGSNNNIQNQTCWPRQHSNGTALCEAPSALTVMEISSAMQTVEERWKGAWPCIWKRALNDSGGIRVQRINPSSPRWVNICLFSVSKSNPTSVELSGLFQPHSFSLFLNF